MKTGDTVIYSQQHYLWLVLAARWHNKHVARAQYKGTVIAGSNGLDGKGAVRVFWSDGSETWHFADNLEQTAEL
jgi:hypothetical protein